MRPLITLLTDFGHTDTYVGQMKGVIAGLCPDARVIDVCHEVPPQDVLVGALLLDEAVDAFPPDTVHCCVVDPGVGTDRHAIAAAVGSFFYVGPDNGLLTEVARRHKLRQAVVIDPAHYRPDVAVSHTFHGRDIFAPATAYLACTRQLHDLGQPLANIVKIDIPEPVVTENSIEGQVLRLDHFGNLITNISVTHLSGSSQWRLYLRQGVSAIVLGNTFADAPSGDLVAYFGSSGRLEIGCRNGNAATACGLQIGERITCKQHA